MLKKIRLGDPPEIWNSLPSSSECGLVVAHFDRVTPFPTQQQAHVIVLKLLGPYWTKEIRDMKIYLEFAIENLKIYPIDVCLELIKPTTGIIIKCRTTPSIPDLREFLDEVVRERRILKYAAEKVMSEINRRIETKRFNDQIKADQERFRAEHGDKSILQVIQEKARQSE